MDVEKVQRAYSSVSDLYIELFGTPQQSHPDDLAFIARHLSGRPGRVLDLGCGPGHLTGYLRSLGVDATGVDVVPEFIAYAKATHPDGRYHLGSMLDPPVDEPVAGILSWYSSIHTPPPELDGVLAGFRRALVPGGTLVVGFFDGGDQVEAFEHKVVTAWRWPVDEFADRLRRAGFTEAERWRRPFDGTHRPHAALAATAT